MEALICEVAGKTDKATADAFAQAICCRDSDLVLLLGQPLLGRIGGSEKYDLLEEIFLASLDCNVVDLAKTCLERLQKAFPKSRRVMRLQGMMLECQGNWLGASDVYAEILEQDPMNQPAMKRQVAICLGQGRPEAAVEALNQYVSVFQADVEAWQQLCNIYLSLDQMRKAAFCLEELILADPESYHTLTRYAEVLYTLGGLQNVVRARQYFARALELCPQSPRALFGLTLAANAAKDGEGRSGGGRNKPLLDLAIGGLREIYADNPQQRRAAVDRVLTSLQQ